MALARITSDERKAVIQDFASRHGGVYDPATFVEEVRSTGPSHAAYRWFTWNDDEAAEKYRVSQARKFAEGLRIEFEVQDVGGGPKSVTVLSAPFAFSPISQRADGGGYRILDPTSREHHLEMAAEALSSLEGWQERYSGTFEVLGIGRRHLTGLLKDLNLRLNSDE